MAIEDCDVFLSFRGEIRRNFACHFSKELKRRGFQTFMDCESIDLGDEIHETIKKAIKHSKSAIVILSDKFASSKHCLNELVLILERNRTSKYFIIPVFYYVETDDVKHQSGKFGAAFEQIKQQHDADKVEEWIAALASIGGILGKEIKEQSGLMESTIIEDILATFEQKFYDHHSKSPPHSQVMPPTKSTLLNIVEPPAAATKGLEETGSSRSKKKGWKTYNKFIRKLCLCVCVCISLVSILLIIMYQYHAKTTGPPPLAPPPPRVYRPNSIPYTAPPPPAFVTRARSGSGVTATPPPALHFSRGG